MRRKVELPHVLRGSFPEIARKRCCQLGVFCISASAPFGAMESTHALEWWTVALMRYGCPDDWTRRDYTYRRCPTRRTTVRLTKALCGLTNTSTSALHRHHLAAHLESVQIIRPRRHHFPALDQVRGSVVGSTVGIANGMRKLMLDEVLSKV